MNEAFGGEAVEQMELIASTGPGGWTETWARKIMEVGEEGEGEEVLGCLHKAMQDEFGHVAARTMIKGIRSFVREQEDGRDRGKKKGREERQQQWRRGEEAWESIGREMRKREGGAGGAIKGEEATIKEEGRKGGKGVGMSGGWFWQTGQQQWQQEDIEQGAMRQGQQEKAGQEAAQQQQQREEEAVRQRQQQPEEAAARQRQQQREEEAARQRQQEEAAQQQEEDARRWQVERKETTNREEQRRRDEEDEKRWREEERQGIQSPMIVKFGRYYGKTCEWVYSRDREYCDWVIRLEASNKNLMQFQEFVRAAERRDKWKELEIREKTLEENRKKRELEKLEKGRREEEEKAEKEAKEKQAVEDMREVMTRMRLNIEAPAETDTMAAAETDTMAAAEKEMTTAVAETGQEAKARVGKEQSWKDDVWWRHGWVRQSEYWNDPKWNKRSAIESPTWCETKDIRQLRPGKTVWHMICTSEEEGNREQEDAVPSPPGIEMHRYECEVKKLNERIRKIEERMEELGQEGQGVNYRVGKEGKRGRKGKGEGEGKGELGRKKGRERRTKGEGIKKKRRGKKKGEGRTKGENKREGENKGEGERSKGREGKGGRGSQ